jgi:hypothetical protein
MAGQGRAMEGGGGGGGEVSDGGAPLESPQTLPHFFPVLRSINAGRALLCQELRAHPRPHPASPLLSSPLRPCFPFFSLIPFLFSSLRFNTVLTVPLAHWHTALRYTGLSSLPHPATTSQLTTKTKKNSERFLGELGKNFFCTRRHPCRLAINLT